MGVWSKVALFERRDGKKDTLLCIEDRSEHVERRYVVLKMKYNCCGTQSLFCLDTDCRTCHILSGTLRLALQPQRSTDLCNKILNSLAWNKQLIPLVGLTMLATWIISFMSLCLRLLAAGMFYFLFLSSVNDCEAYVRVPILQELISRTLVGCRFSVPCLLIRNFMWLFLFLGELFAVNVLWYIFCFMWHSVTF